MNKNILLALTLASFLTACGQKTEAPVAAAPAPVVAPEPPPPSKDDIYKEKAKNAILAVLKDPGSAQFQDLRGADMGGNYSLCGKVNAKNGMGGYMGFKDFCWTEKEGVHPGFFASLN